MSVRTKSIESLFFLLISRILSHFFMNNAGLFDYRPTFFYFLIYLIILKHFQSFRNNYSFNIRKRGQDVTFLQHLAPWLFSFYRLLIAVTSASIDARIISQSIKQSPIYRRFRRRKCIHIYALFLNSKIHSYDS